MLGKNGAKMKQNFRYTWQESKDLNLKPQFFRKTLLFSFMAPEVRFELT